MKMPPIRKLFSKNTVKAFLIYPLKKLFSLECHYFYEFDLSIRELTDITPDKGLQFLHLKKDNYQLLITSDIEAKINSNAGYSLEKRMERGERAFILLEDSDLVCQLFMSHENCQTDTPIPLELNINNKWWFLSFLYTSEKYRNKGMANKLIKFACSELKKLRFSKCIAHIRSTNLASINSFEKSGWTKIASLYSIPKRNLLINPGAARRKHINIKSIS